MRTTGGFELRKTRYYIRKQNSPGFISPYTPCENILEEGAKYEIIITMSCIVYNPQGQVPTVHQIRPLEGPAARTYTRLPRLNTLLTTLGYVLLALFILDVTFWTTINSADKPLPPMNLEEQCTLCSREPLVFLWLRSLIVFFGVLREMNGFLKKLDEAEGLRTRIIKAVLWVIASYVLFNGTMIYFGTFGWWFSKTTSNFLPQELAKYHQLMNDIKRRKATRKFGTLLTVAFICPIVLILMIEAFKQRSSFSPLTHLVHIIFTVILFVYGRFVYVTTLRLLDPRQYADSPGLKKWNNWSLTLRWWFIITLIAVPMTTPVCSCLGQLL